MQHEDHRWLTHMLVLASLVLMTMTAACASTVQTAKDQPPSDKQLTNDAPQPSEQEADHEVAETPEEADAKKDAFGQDKVTVIRAATDIPAGTPLTDDRVKAEDIPTRFLPPNPLLEDDFAIYVGTPVNRNIEDHALILTTDFQVAQVSKNLSDRIPPGERALPLEFANLRFPCEVLEPGDRVDVIGTVPIDNGGEIAADGDIADRVTVTLLQNATTLSIGPNFSAIEASDDDSGCAEFELVTLAVTREEAELLSAVQSAGELRLMVRHPDDIETKPVGRSTLGGMLERIEAIQAERDERVQRRRTSPHSREDSVEIIRSRD